MIHPFASRCAPRTAAAIVISGALSSMLLAAALPVAPTKEVTNTIHGVAVKDTYLHFENVKAPEVQA